MSSLYTPPTQPSAFINADIGSAMPTDTTTMPQQPPYIDDSSATSPPSESSNFSSITIVIVVIASAIIVSSFIYLFIRFLSKRFHHHTFSDVHLQRNTGTASNNANSNQYHAASNNLLDPLPLFDFRSVTGNLTGGDCAVCLSKFEPHDQLRLLPLCCHAFHAVCIDTWLVTNQTCPLCRSTVKPSDSDVLDKIHSIKHPAINNHYNSNSSLRNGNGNDSENSGSFRVEIGSISRRRGATESNEGRLHSYSIGSFEYIVDDGYEVSVESTTHRPLPPDCTSLDKQSSVRVPCGEVLAREDSVGRNWIMDYVDKLASMSMSSHTMSFRNSDSFFSGSSRRSDSVSTVEDLEANRIGEEISEFFQWLSGV
ncbi:E3 ubiquitin-protein ligase ATL4-like [Olea europaea var. sylvestris]|uniref:E3 ubiquitin-protein ligase ATL4-like n=1 Tax=Olea europaea var. sylvestris TaxID=158386 RepID=UPI000C1D6760|nr:E3 ubiquitin-protein ligase ATL4-like [Olea europaea var. sylvestris]